MDNRYERIVLKAEGNISFEVSSNGKEFTIIAREVKKQVNHSENYKKPPIPTGYKHVEGEWNTGFVIEKNSDGSQFVWIPVGKLEANGTYNGESHKEFGRRFASTGEPLELPEELYLEKISNELKEQEKSVQKYGGFYISRYYISKKGSEYISVKDAQNVVTDVSYYEAVAIGSGIEIGKDVSSHLLYASEIDSEIQWINQFKISVGEPIRDEWTKEITYGNYAVIRPNDDTRFSFERKAFSRYTKSNMTAFRIALWIR